MNIPTEAFSMYWVMKDQGIQDAEDKANEMIEVLKNYPHWGKSEEHERVVKLELYRLLINSGMDVESASKIVGLTFRALKGGLA